MAARLRRDLPLDVQAALAEADHLLLDPVGNIHSVGWGIQTANGKEQGEGIVVTVRLKDTRLLDHLGLGFHVPSPLVPMFFGNFRTDVQEQPKQEIQLLQLPYVSTYSVPASRHQECYNTPIPGGVECFPIGKAWLGTLGCKVIFRNEAGQLRHGAITNCHVATGMKGMLLGQPGGNSHWFAKVSHSPGINFSGTNYVDLSVLDTERTDSAYAPSTHTVKAEQVTLGRYLTELSEGGVGTMVARDGRTLGCITNGRVSQIGVTVRVGYGGGQIATFVDQLICTRQGGEFSAPGDSGSMVFEYSNMKPFGLLFAGGGGTTIVSPAEYVISQGGVTQFA